jgi:hypothetical protein
VGADPIWHRWQSGCQVWRGPRRAVPNGLDDQGIGGHRQVIAVLFGVTDRDENHFSTFAFRRQRALRPEVGRQGQPFRFETQVYPLRC